MRVKRRREDGGSSSMSVYTRSLALRRRDPPDEGVRENAQQIDLLRIGVSGEPQQSHAKCSADMPWPRP